MSTLSRLVRHLKKNRNTIVRKVEVMQQVYDPTYGIQDPTICTLEVVDFDKLIESIDKFSQSLKKSTF